jgi:hypothetical protein
VRLNGNEPQNQEVGKFILWTLEQKDLIESAGYLSISQSERESMTLNGIFWVSDLALGHSGVIEEKVLRRLNV